MSASVTAARRPAGLVSAIVLSIALLVGAVALTRPTAVASADAPCTRPGDTLIAASRHVRVVRHRLRPRYGLTRHQFVACWTATRRRTMLGVASQDPNGDLVERARVDLIDDRYVGIVMHTFGGPAEAVRGAVYDVRKGRKLHDTRACGDRADTTKYWGIDEVVFLSEGGMVFTCDRLLIYRRASSQQLEQVEPPGTNVAYIAATDGFVYWHVLSEWDERIAVKSYRLLTGEVLEGGPG